MKKYYQILIKFKQFPSLLPSPLWGEGGVRGHLRYLCLENQGVTLIELLVALVISSILIAALYRVFVSQQQTYTVQDQVIDMQQNARVGINRMMSEIRMAGFGNVSMVLPVTFGQRPSPMW